MSKFTQFRSHRIPLSDVNSCQGLVFIPEGDRERKGSREVAMMFSTLNKIISLSEENDTL